MYLVVRFYILVDAYSHFILFCTFSLSRVFNMSLWLGRLCKHFPRSSTLNKLFYSIPSRNIFGSRLEPKGQRAEFSALKEKKTEWP